MYSGDTNQVLMYPSLGVGHIAERYKHNDHQAVGNPRLIRQLID